MRKLREVLRLSYSADLSIREISASTKISVGSIQNILKRAEQLKITWPLPDDWDDQALALKFYPRSDAQPSSKFQEPVWADVHLELKKKGVTKQLLWEEYTQQYPNRCYSYSQFCARYAEWRKKQNSSDTTRKHRVTPHVFRHTATVQLLEAGVDINVIRGWLGHVNLETTQRYAEINLRTKQAALAACLPPTDTAEASPPNGGWRQDEELMKWLQSL